MTECAVSSSDEPLTCALAQALRTLGGREAQLLALFLLEGRNPAELAAFFGVSEQALHHRLVQAAHALDETLPGMLGSFGPAAIPCISDEGLEPRLGARFSASWHLQRLAPRVQERLVSLRDAEDAGPPSVRMRWLRRALGVFLAAAALYVALRKS